MSVCGFAANRHLEEIGEKVALMAGQVDEAEYLVRIDDDDPEAGGGPEDPVDIKIRRDGVRHVASKDILLKLDYLSRSVNHLAFRVRELRRRNDWVREDLEEPEARVGMCSAEEGTPEHREEVKDGLTRTS